MHRCFLKRAIAHYIIIANPLRAGLCVNVGDYPWWDAEWLQGGFHIAATTASPMPEQDTRWQPSVQMSPVR